jgi:esterase/lipase superfamily enzyme
MFQHSRWLVVFVSLLLAACVSPLHAPAPVVAAPPPMPMPAPVVAAPAPMPTSVPAPRVVPDVTDVEQIVELRYATNRKPAVPFRSDAPFLNQRDTQLHRGIATILIPKAHKRGSQGASYWPFTLIDPPVRFVGAIPLREEDFWRRAKEHLATLNKEERNVVLFVHGYNTDFMRGARIAGQVWANMGIAGMPAFFSWPSLGEKMIGPYVTDMAAADASEKYLVQYITELHANAGPDAKVHVIAHSMGNRLMLRVANRLAAHERWRGALGQVILVAPDVDQELFTDLASAYPTIAKRTTVLVSTSDLPVTFAELLARFPRVGAPPPIQKINNIDMVEVVIKGGVFGLGHSFHAEHTKVIDEMKSLLTTDKPSKYREQHAGGTFLITVSK